MSSIKLIEQLNEMENPLSENDLLMASVQGGNGYTSKKLTLGTLARYVNSTGGYPFAIGPTTRMETIVEYKVNSSSDRGTMPVRLFNQTVPASWTTNNTWWEEANDHEIQHDGILQVILDHSVSAATISGNKVYLSSPDSAYQLMNMSAAEPYPIISPDFDAPGNTFIANIPIRAGTRVKFRVVAAAGQNVNAKRLALVLFYDE